MAWTTPSTAVAGSTALTAAFWNEQVRDNLTALPRGVVAKTTKTATQNFTSSSATDVTDLSLTWTAESDRLYMIYLDGVAAKDQNTGDVTVSLTDASNNVKSQRIFSIVSGLGVVRRFSAILIHYETGLSGSITRKIRVATSTSNVDVPTASATQPMIFMVVDMGLA